MATLEPQEQLVDIAVERYRQTIQSRRGRLMFIAGAEGSGRTRTLARMVERLAYEEPPPLLVAGTMKADTLLAWPNHLTTQHNMVENLHRVVDQKEYAQKLGDLLGMGAPFHPYLGLLSAVASAATVSDKLRTRLLQGRLGALEKAEVPKRLLDLVQQEADKRR